MEAVMKNRKKPKLAWHIFKRITSNPNFPSNAFNQTIPIVTRILIDSEMFTEIDSLQHLILTHPSSTQTFISSLIQLLDKSGHLNIAVSHLQSFLSLNPNKPLSLSLYNLLTRSSLEKNLSYCVRLLYQDMLLSRVSPDTYTFNLLIAALCDSGLIEHARKVFDKVPDRGCVPNEFTFGILVRGYCRSGRARQGLELPQALAAMQISIGKLVGMPLTDGLQDHIFPVLATVDRLYTQSGWCYKSCGECNKELVVKDGLFFCDLCNDFCMYPMIRYRVHVHVVDETSDTIFTIFNSVAEKLFDSCANKLVNRLGIGNDGFPPEFFSLGGRTFEFKVRLPNYFTRDLDFHHYRVVGMYEIHMPPNYCIRSLSRKKLKQLANFYHVDPLFLVETSEDAPPKSVGSVESVGSVSKGGDVADIYAPSKKRA